MAPTFRCVNCHRCSMHPFSQRCAECGGILETCSKPRREGLVASWTQNDDSMWRYVSSLSVDPEAPRVSLGEGGTPLVEVPQLAELLRIRRLRLKLELINPTGSFKDRAMSVVATHARYNRAPGLVGSSSGNALHAQAAYAALAGLPSLALVPESVHAARLVQPLRCGTQVVRVRGDYSVCHQLARDMASASGWYNASTTYENPMGADGYKTVAYELWEEDHDPADWISIPVGAGPLLGAIARGYEDLIGAGCCRQSPALLGVQATNCAPIARAFNLGASKVDPWNGSAKSIAKGIADPLRGYAEDGTYTLAAVKRSQGAMVVVTEEQILGALRTLSLGCGLHVDPAAAAALAGLEIAVRSGVVSRDASVIALITGTGFKEVPEDFSDTELGAVFDPGVDRIEDVLS